MLMASAHAQLTRSDLVALEGYARALRVASARSRPNTFGKRSLPPFARTELRFPTVTRRTDPYRRAAGHPACAAGQFFRGFFLMTIIRNVPCARGRSLN
jgi:hypothetical protein